VKKPAGRRLIHQVMTNLVYYLENEPATSLFAANQLFSSFAGVQAHEKFIKKAAHIIMHQFSLLSG
jgi:hypothetical protein